MPTWLLGLPWKIIGLVVGVIAIVFAVYHAGWKSGDQRATKRIAAYEQSIRDKGAKIVNGQFDVNTKIEKVIERKTNTIYLQRDSNKDLVKNSVKNVGNLSAGWVYVHNLAAIGGTGDTKKASDGTDSLVSTTKALEVINDNYAACKAEVAKLTAFQTWYDDSKKNIDAANSKKGK